MLEKKRNQFKEPQASSAKLTKIQAASVKLKATSNKLLDLAPFKKFHGA